MSNEELIDEEARRKFESDWNENIARRLETYLPDPSDPRYWPTLEELICIDLEFSWKELSDASTEETVSEFRSPASRLKIHSRRFSLEKQTEIYERLSEYDESLRKKTQNRKQKRKPVQDFENFGAAPTKKSTPANVDGELETFVGGGSATAPAEEPQSDQPRADVTTARQPSTPRKEFGDFELEQILGRGGMGVVFRAQEKKTGRQVALKMIRSNYVNQVDETTQRIVLERFQTEAKAVAGIEHPNIVTLYQVGEYENTPFISMRLVNGDDLATHIRRSVFEGKVAARYMKSVAEAVAAAHGKGILHRDIKPHNILLDEEQDQPLVTDFGLAKLLDENEQGVTESGELLGTPGYMSPEQASGKPTDQATDIYSLGATLYCLLGGRAPFQAADSLKIIEQIVKNPPLAPREVNPDVDKDLNTICLKCLEKDPAKRYESAQALADDLGRYLNGEPIKARPVGIVESAVRWCKRNPLPVTVMASTFLLMVTAFIGWRYTAWISEQNRENKNLSYSHASEQLRRILEDRTMSAPGVKLFRVSLLQDNRDFFEKFIRLNGESVGVDGDVAFAHFAIGRIDRDLKEPAEAIPSLDTAIEMQTKLLKQDPDSKAIRFDLANSLNLRGECLLRSGKKEQSKADFDEALEIRQALLDDDPGNLEYQRKLANVRMNIGNWKAAAGNDDAALKEYEAAHEIRKEIIDSDPKEEDLLFNVQYDLAEGLFNSALSLLNLAGLKKGADFAPAEKSASQSVEIFKKLNKDRPRVVETARDLNRASNVLIELRMLMNKDFEKDLVKQEELLRRYRKLYPEEKEFEGYLGRLLLAKAEDMTYSIRSKGLTGSSLNQELINVNAVFKETLACFEVVKDQPEFRLDYGNALFALASHEFVNNNGKEAKLVLGSAKEVINECIKEGDLDAKDHLPRLEQLEHDIAQRYPELYE